MTEFKKPEGYKNINTSTVTNIVKENVKHTNFFSKLLKKIF
jgi:hypothetical protein